MGFYVYMLASQKNGTLYVGSTQNLTVRVSQHQQELIPGFTSRYGVKLLVWFEHHDTRAGAFRRERRIKEWRRAWKVRLIEAGNLEWRDLYQAFAFGPAESPFPALAEAPAPAPSSPLAPAKAGVQDRLEGARPDTRLHQ